MAVSKGVTNSTTAITRTEVEELRKNHAVEYLPLEKEYADITVRDYFSKYGFIFIGTKGITGGKYGKGSINAELDITDESWFFHCHFKGDPASRTSGETGPGCGTFQTQHLP